MEMTAPLRSLPVLAFLLLPGLARAGDTAKTAHATATLAAEDGTVDGKTPFRVVVRLDLAKGWHTYWKNPGDAGLAPSFRWELPPGATASEVLWQPPERIPVGPLMAYGYSGTAYHVVRITPAPAGTPGKAFPIKVEASWLVCAEECVPEQATLDLSLPIGPKNVPSSDAGAIAKLSEAAMPPQAALLSAKESDGALSLTIRLPEAIPGAREAYFFPDVPGVIEPAAPQQAWFQGNTLSLMMKRGLAKIPSPLSGRLQIDGGAQPRFFLVAPSTSTPAKP